MNANVAVAAIAISGAAIAGFYLFSRQSAKRRQQQQKSTLDQVQLLIQNIGHRLTEIGGNISAEQGQNVKENQNSTRIIKLLGGIEHELEAVLAFLDGIRGDTFIKSERRLLVTKINSEVFPLLDKYRHRLKYQ